MESELIKRWIVERLQPSKDFEFFTRRDNIVIGKKWNEPALIEYKCDCGFKEIKTIEMEKGKKKFKRPEFNCSKCGNPIKLLDLKKGK
jgi:predicted SprT family Zn-dependent metalloprotease